ncbi:Uncharacterised protein [Klebsiella pneumoniae]|nr:Uncharacterised protein [Klebsiella pneumoniae]
MCIHLNLMIFTKIIRGFIRVKLLVKDLKNRYEIKPLIECGDKLNQYQIIKYCIRVFVDRDIKERVTPKIIYKINDIVVKQIALLN